MNGFLKQPQQLPGTYLNAGSGMSTQGGQLTTAPSPLVASQGMQDIPGDRMILDAADALALSDTSIGTLYGGLYQFVHVEENPTATATRGRLAFWANDSATTGDYDVSPDEDTFIAGVFINTLTDDYYWWIQIAGQVDAFFVSTLSVATQGVGVYAAMLGAGANVGGLTQQYGIYDNATTQDVDLMLQRYMGQAVELPVANDITLINMPMSRIRF